MGPVEFLSYRRNLWAYFLLFLAANTLISYSGFSFEIKSALILLGIVLPLYVGARTQAGLSFRETPAYEKDLLNPFPGWLLFAGVVAAAFLRFYKLETLFCWPTLDEGWNGILAIELSKHWSWRFFYTFGQAPPLPVWCGALLFKLGCAPAFCLWFPSAVVSLLSVVAGYLAARQFFSQSFSLVCGGLLAFSYWPLFIGRFCHQGIWLPLWVCAVFYLWGRLLKAKDDSARNSRAFALGIGLGLGSFTFTPWIGVAGFTLLSVLWGLKVSSSEGRRQAVYLGTGFLLGLLPFISAVTREGFGHHILSLSPWGGWFHGLDFFTNLFKYFAVLVWGAFEANPAYTPVWGGFLNPLLGAFFFTGLLELGGLFRLGLARWMAIAFLLFLLPGALSPNLETFRIAQVLPLLMWITALGIHGALGRIPTGRKVPVFCLILAFVGGLDFFLLAAPYSNPVAHPENFGRPLKSLEKYLAYQHLKERRPQFLLTDFETDSYNDPTLSLMTYGLNGARNTESDPPQKELWAVFINTHYTPFLRRRFPESQWACFPIGPMRQPADGGNVLGFLSDIPGQVPNLRQWLLAHELFQKADLQRFSQEKADFKAVLQTLESAYPLVKGDPFLESVFWDKRGSYEYEALNYDQHLYSYQMAVTKGYPTADFYFKLGQLLLLKGKKAEAQAAFLKATQAPLDLTPAKAVLDWLNHPPKNDSQEFKR